MLKFQDANAAFHKLYDMIIKDGVDFANTKALFNVGFEILYPQFNTIHNGKIERNWSREYAKLNGNGIYLAIVT